MTTLLSRIDNGSAPPRVTDVGSNRGGAMKGFIYAGIVILAAVAVVATVTSKVVSGAIEVNTNSRVRSSA